MTRRPVAIIVLSLLCDRANAQPGTAAPGIPTPAFGTQFIAREFSEKHLGHYYINHDHPQATDEENDRGTLSRPRRTIPPLPQLQPGSLVLIGGSPPPAGSAYQLPPLSNTLFIAGCGTASEPIIIRGEGQPPPLILEPSPGKDIELAGSYIVLERLDLANVPIRIIPRSAVSCGGHHIAVRECTIRDAPSIGLLIDNNNLATPLLHDIVVFGCAIANNWDRTCSGYDDPCPQDTHGISVGLYASNIWILGNEIWHNGGNGIQLNGFAAGAPRIDGVYIAHNTIHANRQAAIATKEATGIFISSNTLFDNLITHDDDAAGINVNADVTDNADYLTDVWIINNHIYRSVMGIRAQTSKDLYVVGNKFHDIALYGNTAGGRRGWAISLQNGRGDQVATCNTVEAAWGGIEINSGAALTKMHVTNNVIDIISGSPPGEFYHVYVGGATPDLARLVNYDLVWQGAGVNASIRWNGTVYTVSAFRTAFPAYSTGTIQANPVLVDGRLQLGSPAIENGFRHTIFGTFAATYPTHMGIEVDLFGTTRPQGGPIIPGEGFAPPEARWDIGAEEYANWP